MPDVAEEEAVKGMATTWKHIPEEEASLLSRVTFFWARPLFRRASTLHRRGKALEHDDLLPLPTQDHGARIGGEFEQAWEEAYKARTASEQSDKKDKSSSSTVCVRTSIFHMIGRRRFFLVGVLKAFNTGLQFSFPLLLNAILKFIEETQSGAISDDDSWLEQNRGYFLSLALFCAMGGKAITENMYFHHVYRAGYQAKVAVSVAVYGKALRLAASERQGTTLGELVNLMQVDASKIEMFVPQFHVLWDGALQILGYITILFFLIGPSAFAGLFVMIVAAPLQGVIMKRLYGLNRKMVKYTDERVKTTNEALQGIRSVKMYCWEDNFNLVIGKSRTEELGFLKSTSYLKGASRAYMGALPSVVAVISFIVYAVTSDETASASTLFAALVAFDQLRFPLLFYPMSLALMAQASVSAARVESFLSMREVGDEEEAGGGTYSREDKGCDTGELSVEDATIFWSDPAVPIQSTNEKENDSKSETATSVDLESDELTEHYPKPILSNVSLNIAQGELCAVVGRVGSGKSSLCSALLHETVLGSGRIALKGSVAYAAQSPWVLNASLKDNILFGQPFDEEKYERIIEACQLTHDLKVLGGDEIQIGERGINLSGGQKQRVSVARAAYSDADIIILDDPLSALDPAVGTDLFEECILGVMKGKTRLLVTNQLQCLKKCDTVVALGDGIVLEQGSFSDLSSGKGEVQRILDDLKKTSMRDTNDATGGDDEAVDSSKPFIDRDEEKTAVSTARDDSSPLPTKDLLTKEERNIGSVSLSVYLKYLQAGGGYLAFCGVYFMFILCAANGLSSGIMVSLWTADAEYERNSEAFYLGLYLVIAVSLGIFTFTRSYLLARFGVRASNQLHRNLLSSVLKAPMSFFDTTPTGRIISRFSKDMYSVDLELADQLDFFLFCSITVVVSLGTILFVTPWFGIAIIPIAIVYLRILNYFREVSRETKRLESISRSPVYAHFSETLNGLGTIRAYGRQQPFIDEFEGKIDQNTRGYYCNKVADRWLAIRLEFLGAMIAGLAAVFAANVATSGSASGKESNDEFASLAGLSITYAISVTSLMNFGVRSFAQLEASLNACERVLFYTESIPQEAPSTSSELEAHALSSSPPKSDPSSFAVAAAGGKAINVSSSWPSKGAMTLKNLRMKYREDTPMVLKGLNVTVVGGERVGVVGRTGSGKSSLLLCLLRIVEPTLSDEMMEYDAPVTIDGVDILRIGLRDLRSKLGIIPQNPVLFSGSVRSNLDPFDDYTDEEIWNALGRCGMRTAVEAMSDGISSPVAEYGDNLSQGQRQLLCLGRALLRQCRILLLDEATSSVDYETDREIQRTLREAFPGSTVLTIAHRVNTIMDSDKILVMKDGMAEEFASPKDLLNDENSIFSEIVRAAGQDHK